MTDDRMIHVSREGTIYADGEAIGRVDKVEGLGLAMGKWRAEVGTVAEPETYRAVYAPTRKEAVAEAVAS